MSLSNLYSIWQDHPIDYTYSCECVGNYTSTFTLDHILTLRSSKQDISSAGVLHLVENTSDHEPIYAVIKVDHKDDTINYAEKPNFKPKPCWRTDGSDGKKSAPAP